MLFVVLCKFSLTIQFDRSLLFSMNEWTDEFISNAQVELVSMVDDWKYDYGADDKACIAMLSWMILKINPTIPLDVDLIL